MHPVLIGLVIGLGSAVGLWLEFPHAQPAGLAMFGALNAVFGIVASSVLFLAAEVVFGVYRRPR